MPKKQHSTDEIIGKLREVEVLVGWGSSLGEAVRSISVTEQTYYRWRKEYGGLKMDPTKRLKGLGRENVRLRKAVADPTLDKQILAEVAKGNF